MSNKTKALLVLFFGIIIGAPSPALTKIGLKRTSANSTMLIQSVIPIITAIFSFIVIKEKISNIKWLAISFGLLGTWYTILLPAIETNSISGNMYGNILILLGAIVYCLYMVLLKKAQRTHSMITIVSMMIFAGLLVFSLLSLTEKFDYSLMMNNVSNLAKLSLFYLALTITIGSYLLSQYRIKLAGPVAASLDFYLGPPVGYLFSYILLGEILTPGLLIGTILV